MPGWLVRFCEWLQDSPVGMAVGGTLWGYPYVQLLHFFGLSLWLGTIAMLDLRLLGVAGRDRKVTELSELLFPWSWIGLGLVLTGGLLLFSPGAKNYVYNPAFQIKFLLVLTGIAYHVAILCNLRKWDRGPATPPVAKVAAAAELLLWISVVTAAVNMPLH